MIDRVGNGGGDADDADLAHALGAEPAHHAVVLVDELAHTNAPGSRYEKRWQDVEEILSSGIDVWTTLNVQHLESLNDVVARITRIRVRETVPDHVVDAADEVELARIISNLLENARRYGKTIDTDVASVDIAAKGNEEWVLIKVRDHGAGVAPEQLANLTKPFYRGDTARTAATGAGLGLAIVEKTVQRMGGIFALANSATGGLVAHVQLQRGQDMPPGADLQQRLHRPQVKRKLPPQQPTKA